MTLVSREWEYKIIIKHQISKPPRKAAFVKWPTAVISISVGDVFLAAVIKLVFVNYTFLQPPVVFLHQLVSLRQTT